MSDSVRPHRPQPTRLRCPWDSPGKNTGVGCHFLIQCMKVKSESEVAQSCPTLRDPMDCSLPGSSIHGYSDIFFPAPQWKWKQSHDFSDHAYIIKGPVVTLNHIVSIPFQIKCLSHKMMRASRLLPGEISSHRRPLRWAYLFNAGGEHGPLPLCRYPPLLTGILLTFLSDLPPQLHPEDTEVLFHQ